jgi:three-Cys-motif partner protein
LRALGANVTEFAGAADETVTRMAAAVPPGALCMAYVDPYCLNLLDFNMLRQLAKLKVDLAVHFSTMDLQRNVIVDVSEDRGRFDPVAPGWQGAVNIGAVGVQQLRHAFFEYWRQLLLGLGFSHSKEMPIVYNTNGAAIYKLVFFARHDMPLKVWGDVARSPNRNLFDF